MPAVQRSKSLHPKDYYSYQYIKVWRLKKAISSMTSITFYMHVPLCAR